MRTRTKGALTMMFPRPASTDAGLLDGGMALQGTTSGNVPASAAVIGGVAMKSDGTLYVVFL